MEIRDYIPVFDQLTSAQQEQLVASASLRQVSAGTLLHNGSADCLGLLLVRSGQLRASLTSDEGREITLYRLFDRDLCLFSASCMMKSIQFDVVISAEKDTEFWLISAAGYQKVMEESPVLANYTNEIMAARFSEVMWLMEQIMWKSIDARVADFLLNESVIENSHTLRLTHEAIAGHIGTAREVVTRMLRYFQSEGLVKLTRGTVEITDPTRLSQIRK